MPVLKRSNHSSAVLAAILSLAATAVGKVTVTEVTPDRVVFEWELTSYRIAEEMQDGRRVARLVSADANCEVRTPGGASMPGYTFYVGLPPNGRATAVLRPQRAQTTRVERPIVRAADGDKAVRFAQPNLTAAQMARFGRLAAAKFSLVPFVCDGGELRVLEKARVEVRIGGNTAVAVPQPRPTHFDPVLQRVMLNYEIARGWRTRGPSTALRKSQQAAFPVPARGDALTFTIGDGHSGLNEGTTEENGLVRISGADIAAVLGDGIPIDKIALLAGVKGELGRNRPDPAVGAPLRLVRIPLLRVDTDGDGRLDDGDSFVAWVTGGSDWHFDPAVSEYRYRLNRYDDYRRYWIVYDEDNALSMDTAAIGGLQPERTVDHFTDRRYVKRSRLMPSDGRTATLTWVWEKLTTSNKTATYSLPVVDPDPDSTGSVRVLFQTVKGSDDFSMRFGGADVCAVCSPSQWYDIDSWENAIVEIRYDGGVGTEACVEIEHFELRYSRPLDMSGHSSMTVFSPTVSGAVEYTLTGLPSGELVYIVRIPEDETGISLVDTVRADGGEYSWVDDGGKGIRYHIATASGFRRSPRPQAYRSANTSAYSLTDLRGGDECDYLIIYHDEFAEQADRLAAHKASMRRFSDPRTVDIADVYREFSGGHLDPTAIRNFLWHAKRFWPHGEKLGYVVLMGLGHFDYKQFSTDEPVFIPITLETGGHYKCIEQYFVDDSADAILGRLPCASADEAEAIVDKIVAMEKVGVADFGAWRNRIVMVADNDRQGMQIDHITHYAQSEEVARAIQTQWAPVDMLKVYLFEYEFNDSWSMPAAARTLQSEINAGVGFVNYFGHGGDNVWADERVLDIEDIQTLHNTGRYPLVTSLSCSVGKFDIPGHDCLSDLLVRAANAGAIGVVSSTREAWATPNKALGLSIYKALFDPDHPVSIGQAYKAGRLENEGKSGLEAYALLGDPSIQFMAPSRTVELHVEDNEGGVIDSIMALQRVKVAGSVRRMDGSSDTRFGSSSSPASVRLGLYNPADSSRRKDGLLPDDKVYVMPGSPLFVGQVPVVGGTFSQEVLVPRNVVFDRAGARLIAYAWQDTAVGLGFDTSFVFHGTDTTGGSANDTVGPTIAVRMVSNTETAGSEPAYTDGFSGTLPLACEIVVTDPNGIDVVGTGPDEGLTLEIPGVLSKRSINHTFQFAEGDYREGVAPFVLNEGQVQPGHYRMRISARDLLENLSLLSVDIEIVEATELQLDHVFNYPNPMRMHEATRFYYNMPSSPYVAPAGLVLRIYTLSGKLIRAVQHPENGYEWDGTDQFGNFLSPNVYLYQFTAWNNAGTDEPLTSPIRRLVIHPPR